MFRNFSKVMFLCVEQNQKRNKNLCKNKNIIKLFNFNDDLSLD